MDVGPLQGFVTPILGNQEELLLRTTVQVNADEEEQTAEYAALLVTIMTDTATPVGLRTGTKSDRMIKNKDEEKAKVMLPKLDLGSIAKKVM